MSWFIDKLEKEIKNILVNHPFTQSLLKYYDIDNDDISKHLKIEVSDDLGKSFSEGNGEKIRINKILLNDNFFTENFHFIIHEFIHWLKRRNQEKYYFNDPEEIQSFAAQIAWEKIKGKDDNEIQNVFFPIIGTHFVDKEKAKEFFNKILQSSQEIFEIYKNK